MSRCLRGVLVALALLPVVVPRALAYTPGTGTLLTESFEDGTDDGWVTAGGGTISRFVIADRGGAKVYLAHGAPDLFRLLPETAEHGFHPVRPGSLDVCLRIVEPRAVGSLLRLDLRPPRNDAPAHHRLTITESGALELSLVTAGIGAWAPNALLFSGDPTLPRMNMTEHPFSALARHPGAAPAPSARRNGAFGGVHRHVGGQDVGTPDPKHQFGPREPGASPSAA